MASKYLLQAPGHMHWEPNEWTRGAGCVLREVAWPHSTTAWGQTTTEHREHCWAPHSTDNTFRRREKSPGKLNHDIFVYLRKTSWICISLALTPNLTLQRLSFNTVQKSLDLWNSPWQGGFRFIKMCLSFHTSIKLDWCPHSIYFQMEEQSFGSLLSTCSDLGQQGQQLATATMDSSESCPGQTACCSQLPPCELKTRIRAVSKAKCYTNFCTSSIRNNKRCSNHLLLPYSILRQAGRTWVPNRAGKCIHCPKFCFDC